MTGPVSDPNNSAFKIVDEGDTPPIPQDFGWVPAWANGEAFDTGFTKDEAYALLTGQATVTAAGGLEYDEPDGDDDSDEDIADQNTGAMIALIPSDVDAVRMALDGGETSDDLHLTILYLGEGADYDTATRQAIIDTIQEVVLNQAAVTVTGFGVGFWNPDGDTPALVMNVGGCELDSIHDGICEAVEDVWAAYVPEQHSPWVPHVCLAYNARPTAVSSALSKVGPITFDRVRVAFAGEYIDIPLLVGMQVAARGETMDVDLAADTPAPTGGQAPIGNTDLPSAPMFSTGGTAWQGVLVVEGVTTGDGRQFAPGSLTWADLPLPLMWAPENLGEHMGSRIVGRIDQVWRDPANPSIINGAGVFDDAGVDGAEALRQVRAGILKGDSVDVDSVSDADVEMVFPESTGDEMEDMFAMPELTIFHAGRIRGATLVSIPAFTEASISLMDTLAAPAPSGDSAPAAPPAYSTSSDSWDVNMQLRNLGAYMSDDIASHAFAWVDRAAVKNGAVHTTSCRFLHHHVDGGRVGDANLTACTTAIGSLLSNAKLGMSLQDRRMAYEHLAEHVKAAGLRPQEFSNEAFSDEVQALYASGIPEGLEPPPLELFGNPLLTEPTALQIVQAGGYQHVFGHAACWGSCHISMPDACVTPPHEDEHVYYRLGEVVTASGDRIAVGQITLGTGHAPTFGIDPRKAQEHYDNTGSCVALVASGNDDHGIWVSGIIKPGTPDGRVMELAGAKLSGDWRRIGGSLRLVAMLAVNVPGFPVPRLKTQVVSGKQLSLVASGIMPDAASLRSSRDSAAHRAVAASLQKRLGRDPQTLASELRNRILKGE